MRAKKLGAMALIAAGAALGLWLFVGVLLPLLLPVFLGLAVALAAKKPVAALQRKTGLPRGLAAFFCVLGIYAAAGAGLFLLYRQAVLRLDAQNGKGEASWNCMKNCRR